MAAFGSMVSKKYEVDESYWIVGTNSNLSAEQKSHRTAKLDKEGKRLENKAFAFALFALVTFVTATGLLIKRHKIIEL
jgi:hypothetical protein